jgi:hypothetical protein
VKFPFSFNLRSRARDLENDRQRRDAVINQIRSEIQSATAEINGLRSRLLAEYAHQAAILDNADDYENRSKADEKSLRDAEGITRRAQARIEALESELRLFRQLEAMCLEAGEAVAG